MYRQQYDDSNSWLQESRYFIVHSSIYLSPNIIVTEAGLRTNKELKMVWYYVCVCVCVCVCDREAGVADVCLFCLCVSLCV